jgi:hypothetical protein
MMQPGYIPALMHEQQMSAERSERQQRIAEAWAYYERRHPDQLTVQRGQPNDNTVINLARQLVDKGVSLLFGKVPEWQFDETDSAETSAEQYVDGVWDANKKPTLLLGLALNGALAGLAAIKIKPCMNGSIKLINLDPAYLDICTDEEDITEVWRYRTEYKVDRNGAGVMRRQDTTKQENDTWLVEDFEAPIAGRDLFWRPTSVPVIWPYPFAPIVTCQNLVNPNSVWGYSDLEDITLNDAVNGSVSSTRKLIRLMQPQTIIKGAPAAGIKRGADRIWEIPESADIFNLELNNDLNSARQFYLDMRAAMCAQGRMPDMSQVGNLGALTNFGLRVLFADALERTNQKRNLYGDLIRQINTALAVIGGYGEQETSITWPDPLPTNSTEVAATVTTEKATGLVSDETLTTKLGYDYDDEQERLTDEAAIRSANQPTITVTPIETGTPEPTPITDQPDEAS